MQTEIIIAGFGGQGVLFAGQVLAYAAMDSGKEVTWFPSYGPEMRGGTANCTVVIADEEIGSPLVKHPPFAIALNLPSFDKYEREMQPGGALVVNQSMVDRAAERTDIHTIMIPANDIAEQIGNKKLINMVTVGALMAAMHSARPGLLTLEAIEEALRAHLPARHQHLLPQNFQALQRGYDIAREQLDAV